MGARNYLIEGVSGTGKTTVCDALLRRGYHAIHGDRELAYQGDPRTGEALPGMCHEHHIWDLERVSAIINDHDHAVTFLCGGSRNFERFVDLLDGVFVLDLEWSLLEPRLRARGPDEWGGREEERSLVKRVHATKEDIPAHAIAISSARPVEEVVDEILSHISSS